jgi:hypothetical protein
MVSGDNPKDSIFVDNTPVQRGLYLGRIKDNNRFYYTPCAVLDVSDCNPNNYPWEPLSAKDLGCSDVVGCVGWKVKLSEQDRNDLRLGLRVQGKDVGSSPITKTSIADPGGWGGIGRWPIWAFCVFLAMKFGKAWEEFLFPRNPKEPLN